MVVEPERIEEIRLRYKALAPVLDERRTRLWAAAEARALGYGGNAAVTKATGIRGKRIWKGIRELERAERQPPVQPPQRQRVRAPGAGRKTATEADPALWPDLESLLDPITRRSGVGTSLDDEEHATAGRGAEGAGAPRELSHGREAAR
jgi:hypothetical protein